MPKRGEGLTIDELAVAAGTPARTLRYWQSLGLIPKPQREGRCVRYGQGHLRRAQLVSSLAARGVQLDAAADLLDLLQNGGDSLREWLGISWEEVGEANPILSEDHQVRLSAEELVQSLDGQAEVVQGLVRMHVIRPSEQGMWVAPSKGLLELALRVHRLGVDVETAVGAEAILRHHVRELADELVGWFEARLPPASSSRAGWARLGALRPIGADAVRLILWQELTHAFRRRARGTAGTEREVELPRWFRWIVGRRSSAGQAPARGSLTTRG